MRAGQGRRRRVPLPLRGSRRRELAVARFALDHVRVRRGQHEEAWLPLGAWAARAAATRSIPDQAEVAKGP
jgi:hypothetical protein